MTYDPDRHLPESIRWQEHDYAAGGTYFVTICTADRACLFGDVRDGAMHVNALGRIVEDEWVRSEAMRPAVEIDVFAVMPNHLHGLVTIRLTEPTNLKVELLTMDSRGRNVGARGAPLRRSGGSLGSIIAGFKASSTRRIVAATGAEGDRVWQRGYFDRVVRNDVEFEAIAEYIVTNPERWEMDAQHP